MPRYTLWTMPASLYSGKARAYLRTHQIDFIERAAGEPHYTEDIVPAIGRWIIPVLETPEGDLIQDTVSIIDALDAHEPPERSAYPATPRHLAVAHLLELFGGEGLLRPAMHYRWDFDETNLSFLSKDFSATLAPSADAATREAVFAFASDRMRTATQAFGVTPELAAEVEDSYLEFLTLLNEHLGTAPFLLGGRPTIADYGFMGPLYAHLARDPYPSVLMKQRAPKVWRWVERMNASNRDVGEFGEYPEALFPEDAIPSTLMALLSYIGEEFLAEMTAQVSAVDAWLEEHPEVNDGEVVLGKPSRRSMGTTTFDWRGTPMTVTVIPYRMWMLKRLHDAARAAGPEGFEQVTATFEAAGLDPLLELRPRRWVERSDNREVWGPLQAPVLER